MKKFVKILSMVFALSLTFTIFGCNLGVSHKNPTADSYFNFTLLGDDTYSISVKDKNDLPSQIILPSTYQGKEITTIDLYGFAGTSITKISMPSGYKVIGGYAFENCNKLATIEWSDTLETIEQGAFSGCTGLYNTIILPKSVLTISARAFELCTNLSVIDINANCVYQADSFESTTTINKI